jgi:hypothetical protein
MSKKAKPNKKKTGVRYAVRNGAVSVRCPECNSPSRVLRTTLGERLIKTVKKNRTNYVRRERRCISPANHKFITEERVR